MASIRFKLLLAFFAIIGILTLLNIALIVTHQDIVEQYEQVDNNIFLQFQLIGMTSDLIKAYNNYRNIPTPDNLRLYREVQTRITSTVISLKGSVVNDASKEALLGVENTIGNVTSELEIGLRRIGEGDIANSSAYYAEANRKFPFVQENTSDMILKELEYAQILQLQTRNTNASSIRVGLILLGTIIVGCLLLSLLLARTLISPLGQLTALAKVIAAGNLNVKVDDRLLDAQDEVGSLAHSFNTMIGSLRKTIASLEESNRKTMESTRQAVEAKEALQVKNDELGRLNKVFVDRELKMIEMKARISNLEETLASGQPGSVQPAATVPQEKPPTS